VQDKGIVILGSTGSIGTQALDVIDRLNVSGHGYDVLGLSAGRNIDLLIEQIDRFSPTAVAVADEAGVDILRRRFPDLSVFHGSDGLERLARVDGASVVVNALVGAIGLAPSLAALATGRTLALANKESLVIGGELVTDLVREKRVSLLPIDSEHNALWQCMRAGKHAEIERVIITASGGPFLQAPLEQLQTVTAADALRHPNWEMGARITIDSATMVNKAFEVIEAHHLFDLPFEKIMPLVHPQSLIHSLVEYVDGSILAEMATSDMRIPIQYALTYPSRVETDLPRLSLNRMGELSFASLDLNRYPAFTTVLDAGKRGGTAPAAVNAADEVLVERFLRGDIGFAMIATGIAEVFARWENTFAEDEALLTLERILAVDGWARAQAEGITL